MNANSERASRPKAISYLRVSTKEQTERDGDPEGYSIPAQRDANRRKAEALGAEIIDEFVDRGESAKTADRPELLRMLEFVKEHPVAYCIVHKVDRLARNRADDVAINIALRASHVQLVSATENIDETPSGMLLHGIMSSISEFYSENLKAEVLKGMQQKAKTGGTPGRAPIGYRNVGVFNSEGREVRSVVVDPQRAPLIAWAYEAYATGNWTIRNLADELENRGLTSLPTPSRPSKPISPTQLHKILTNPYYRGEVRFQGARFPGRHEAIVDSVLWLKVQSVLSFRAVGEKEREHNHYLKSTLFCEKCGSRMIVHRTTNRHGAFYEYFVCSGRHERRNDCKMPAIEIGLIENRVVGLYRKVQIEPEERAGLELQLRADLAIGSERAQRIQHDLVLEQARLQARSKKLLDGHLEGVVPMDLYAVEQRAITEKLGSITEALAATSVQLDELDRKLTEVLSLTESCLETYLRGSDEVRRKLNQAFFPKIFVDYDGDVTGELGAPFSAVIPRILRSVQVSDHSETNEHPKPFFKVECSREYELVLQSDHLANIRKAARPLFNLARSSKFAQLLASPVRDERPAFDQVKQLTPGVVDQLVDEYRAGASVYELQKRHGMHRSTIASHLKQRGLTLGRQPLSESERTWALELHDQGLSLNAIGRKMRRDPKTVRSALI